MMAKKLTKDQIASVMAMSEDHMERVVGKALVLLFNRQTADERQVNVTNHTNHRGFSQADARVGCIAAKTYIKHGKLTYWQLERWIKPSKGGYPYICKYARQLGEEAKA
jgi:hypothetical protein